MPARAALAPRRLPGRLARLGVLPEYEIERILLGRIDLDPLAGAQIVERLAGQFSVAGKLAYRVIHVAIGCLVGQAVVFQLADDALHLRHILGGARLVVGAQDAQRVGILVHGGDEAVSQLLDRLAVLDGALDDLVVNVGDVADVGHVVTGGLQPAVNHVENHHHAGVAKVAVVIDGHAADVHANLVRFDGGEYLFFAFQRVVDL